ncbi:MAG: CoA transferase, partial [Deltaproteobacteria bacterium]|nr:CoA transferase [Deltaproteobacteria bacterium]
SQGEASLHFLAPALLDTWENQRKQERNANHDLNYAPHGVYPTTGTDCWIAIAVTTDDQWRGLCGVMKRTELETDARFSTTAARLAHQQELDDLLAAWTQNQDKFALEAALQAGGVPATAVRTMKELAADPQIVHRQHFVELDHPKFGKTTVEGSRFRLSRTPARIEGAAPTMGRDNQYVLETLLGYSEERITEIVASGVLE